MATQHYCTDFLSPLGRVHLRGTAFAIQALFLEEQRHRTSPRYDAIPDPAPLRLAKEQVEQFLAGERVSFSLPHDLQGTPFQLRVWHELLSIPYGETATYGEIARRIGAPRASRAVGSAIGGNPLLLVVPCHRVTGAAGALCGYSGGLPQKRFLLALEKNSASPHLLPPPSPRDGIHPAAGF